MATRHRAKVVTSNGLRTCFEARRKRMGKPDLVARFGGIILRQDRRAVITDPAPVQVRVPRKELLARLRQRECELCEAGTTVAVHQVTGLNNSEDQDRANPRGPRSWPRCDARRSSSARRAMTGSTRTLLRTRHKSLESPVPGKRARRVRREAARKRTAFTWNAKPRRAAHPTGSNAPPRRAGKPSTRAKGAR